ncbi:hypothetical protein DL89DRAFT_319847 [Linderina pennispora]|uniref:DUF8032 domain-containing protein n=1 Tax=Linderina pennispora TaxID=61395 RepID=A0A1Y1WLM1_9FUNG|nr:uncharacterized protein DL89DRAFT_319847 [Linderina pennispora]ORX74265.1 hypothetical protein DL89DRAFT_319847 [Linderina pennispora]
MRPGTAQPSTTPPAPPSSVISDTHTQQPPNDISAPADDVINSLFTKEPLDMDLLTELLGSLDGTAASTPTMNSVGVNADDAMELGGITTAAVLDGLRSLDEFERQAAIHTDGYTHETVSHTPIDEGELADSILRAANSAELSAALEQLYWGSLEVPAVDPMATTHGGMWPGSPQIDASMGSAAVWPSNATECSRDEPMDDETDDENPLELEELSLFSLFLSDMKAFEGFLDKLSLNQLRQCAATVNSVLVRRENAVNDPPPPKQPRIVQKRPSPIGISVEASRPWRKTPNGGSSDDALPVTTLSLLREWLPPSTADCVITALQAANLTNPTAARPPARQAAAAVSSIKASATQQRTRADSSQAASDVTLETDPEGVPWMIFSYVQKGKPKWHRIRIDSFQKNNCVYPRANCHESAYTGNRWDYETTCNELLSGRRGLLQSAVNKYRDKVEGHKSRRITRLEKSERSQRSKPGKRPLAKPPRQRVEKRPRVEGADPTVLAAFSAAGTSAAVAAAVANAVSELPRTLSLPQNGAPSTSAPVTPAPASVQSAQHLTVSLFVNNQFMPIDVDINFSKIDDNTEVEEPRPGDQQQTTPEAWARKRAEREQFKQDHAVFPRVLDLEHSRYGGMPGRWEFELTCNEMAWKLALLNDRLRYRMPLIQKCIDTYRTKFAQPPHVSVRFYDLWIPRPGRRRLVAVSRDAEVVDQATAVSHNTSLGSVPIQQAKAEGNPTKEAVVVTHVGQQYWIRDGCKTEDRATKVITTILACVIGYIIAAFQHVSIRPSSVRPPIVQTPQVRPLPRPQVPPTQQQPQKQQKQQQQQQFTSCEPCVSATGASSSAATSTPAATSASASTYSDQLPPATPPAPAPSTAAASAHNRTLQCGSCPTATGSDTPRVTCSRNIRSAIDSAGPSTSAKAQVAASVLTDVLRRFAKTDPALAQLTSVLKEPQGGPVRSASEEEEPLDAKVAELEKLLTELQK